MQRRHAHLLIPLSATAAFALLLCVGCEREPDPAGGLSPTPARTQPPVSNDGAAHSALTEEFAGVRGALPEGWVPEPPASSMRAAQYRIPGSGDIEDAEVAVFAGISGGNDANITRWVLQFTAEDGSGVEPTLTTFEAGGMPVTLVSLTGTYAGMMPSGAPTEPQPNTEFLAAIVEGPISTLHIRMVGPQVTIDANRDAFMTFVRGLRPG